jgi:hypothetical protein
VRVKVIGHGEAAKALRGHLAAFSDVAVVNALPDFTVELRGCLGEHPIVDGVEGALEAHLVSELAALCGQVLVQRAGGNQRDDMIVVSVPPHLEDKAERAIFRALTGRMAKVKPRWWRRRLL